MFDHTLLQDRVAVITGGGTGIGLAIARRLGTLGARIAIASRQSRISSTAGTRSANAGIDALAVQLDVRQPEQVDEMVERTVKHFGALDILVNNAAGNFICRAEELTPNGWNAVIGIVLNGSFYCSRAVGQYMIASKRGGSIVSILANYVWTGSAGTIHSAAAKAGVMSMTQTLAVEWADHGIRVNAVAPGPIESPGAARQLWNTQAAVDRITAAVPLRRWGKPEEVADAVAFLASPLAGVHHWRGARSRRGCLARSWAVQLPGRAAKEIVEFCVEGLTQNDRRNRRHNSGASSGQRTDFASRRRQSSRARTVGGA